MPNTVSWEPEYRQFDLILRSKLNDLRGIQTIRPWSLGLNNRILNATSDAPPFSTRRRTILINFGVFCGELIPPMPFKNPERYLVGGNQAKLRRVFYELLNRFDPRPGRSVQRERFRFWARFLRRMYSDATFSLGVSHEMCEYLETKCVLVINDFDLSQSLR